MKSAVKNGASAAVDKEFEQVPVTNLRPERVRRPSFMIFGVLLVLLAALAGAMLFRASNSRSKALVLRNDMVAGQELSAEDLSTIDLDSVPKLAWVSVGEQDSIVGRSARGPLSQGQLVSASMFDERAATIGVNTVIVAVAVRPGAMPPTAQTGDVVRMQLIDIADESDPTAVGQSIPIGEAVVWSITEAGSTPGDVIVELAVPVENEREVSQAASTGRMKLNLTGEE